MNIILVSDRLVKSHARSFSGIHFLSVCFSLVERECAHFVFASGDSDFHAVW
jgi:hypothetical protein